MLILALLQAALKPVKQGLHKDQHLLLHLLTMLETSYKLTKQKPLFNLEIKAAVFTDLGKLKNHHAELKLGMFIRPAEKKRS